MADITSILAPLSSADVVNTDLAYLGSPDAPGRRPMFDTLWSEFPAVKDLIGEPPYQLHMPVPSFRVPERALSPNWRSFIDYHTSQAFLDDFFRVFGDAFEQTYPGKLEDVRKMSVGPAGPEPKYDINLEVNFLINPEINGKTYSRPAHLDFADKLYVSVWFFPFEGDETPGGDFTLYKITNPNYEFQEYNHFLDSDVEAIDAVRYAPNNVAMLLNSPTGVHGVSARAPSPFTRRAMYISAYLKQPLFDPLPGMFGVRND